MSRTERIPTRLGLPLSAVLGLALLGVPRAVAHDLGPVGRIPNALLVFVPVAVWLGVVLWRRVPNAFLTLLAVGLAYGVLLGLTHQVLWACALDTPPPRIGGTVEGVLPPAAEAFDRCRTLHQTCRRVDVLHNYRLQIEAAIEALRGLRSEVTARGKILAELGGEETEVTRELAERDARLRSRLVIFDECQEMFRHERYGDEAKELAIKVMMKARKCAITLGFITPAPAADSLPRDLAKTVSHSIDTLGLGGFVHQHGRRKGRRLIPSH